MLQRSDFGTVEPGDPYPPIPEGMSFEDIVESIKNDRDIFDFTFDLSPFTYEKFEECDAQALRDYRARLLELGFVITDEENKVWDEQIKEYEEEYGSDD